MRPRAAAVTLVALALAACGSEEEEPRRGAEPHEPAEARAPDPDAGDEEVITEWNDALNADDFDLAAEYFATGAVVEQVTEARLEDRADAVAFNRSLPCGSELSDVEPEDGATVATFDLVDGPGGACEGTAQVRFVVEDGLIEEWRQLPTPPPAEGDVA